MKNIQSFYRIMNLLFLLGLSLVTFGQAKLTGSWKYTTPQGEMRMQIDASTITINNQAYPYQINGNVLMINEGAATNPYPFMLDGDQLTIEFPGGTQILFDRMKTGTQINTLPQSMSKPSGTLPDNKPAGLSGKWIFRNDQGQLVLEFISGNQLIFNGEQAQYQLKEGVVQVMGEYGWIDYPYLLERDRLTVTFPDASKITFSRVTAGGNMDQTAGNRQSAGSAWQLKGMLCSWSGSSTSTSSYSSSGRVYFDGQGNFKYGSEGSFSSGAGNAYSSNPNEQSGTYSINGDIVTLVFSSGESIQVKVNMRQNNGMITELMHGKTLYATGLCD